MRRGRRSGTTADSLPAQLVGLLGEELSAGAEALLDTDLVGRVRAVRRGAARKSTLDEVSRLFGAHLLDPGVQAESERCRTRAIQLAAAAGDSERVLLAYASDLFVLCTIERPWLREEAQAITTKLASLVELSREAVSLQLFLEAIRTPELLDLPPTVALETQLQLVTALSPIGEASLWIKDSNGRAACIGGAGAMGQTRRVRAVAAEALDGTIAAGDSRGTLIGTPVLRWDTPWAALVARTRVEHRVASSVFLSEAAAAIGPVIERELVLDRSAARERVLVRASERRLGRLAFDLHDGALQHVAALGADLFFVRRQLTQLLPAESEALGASRIDDLEARTWELDRVLRELAHSLEPGSLVRRPLARVINDEAVAFTDRTGIPVDQRLQGDFTGMTVSQKIALIRVVQEALTNIREHACATQVRIEITTRRGRVDARIVDDGVGFHVARTLLDAAQRGRLGLVGGSERIRLLGGRFDVRSKPGGPTTVSLGLPHWRPMGVEQSGDAALPVFVSE
jgi:signal transduction histidine kinase